MCHRDSVASFPKGIALIAVSAFFIFVAIIMINLLCFGVVKPRGAVRPRVTPVSVVVAAITECCNSVFKTILSLTK